MASTWRILILVFASFAVACSAGTSVTPDATKPLTTPPTASPDEQPADLSPRQTGLINAPVHQTIPTYDGTGQAVHPDIAYFPNGWQGYAYWLVMTPLAFDSDGRENPSVLVSNDGSSWAPPPGLTNPLVPPPPCDHNSDPDIVYNPATDELFVYYTEVLREERCGAGLNENNVQLLRSTDGINWTGPQTVLSFNLDTDPLYVSPAVLYRDGRFELWMASTDDEVVYTTSEDGVTWSALQRVEIAQFQWHLDVQYIESKAEYWMLFVDSPVAGANLKFAASEDGLRWTDYSAPLLAPAAGWDDERIYRSSFLYDETRDILSVWYSAKNTAGEWRIGFAEESYTGLLRWLTERPDSPNG